MKFSKSLTCCGVNALRALPNAWEACPLDAFVKSRSRLYAMPVFRQTHSFLFGFSKQPLNQGQVVIEGF